MAFADSDDVYPRVLVVLGRALRHDADSDFVDGELKALEFSGRCVERADGSDEKLVHREAPCRGVVELHTNLLAVGAKDHDDSCDV